ncbi:MAG: acetylxylan esterase [Pirellulaceae bacterium]|jgi:hypothetical protein|nr:acetylxylan esterase [Pirellulaceae bacterium]MDP7015238.1 acetylxylan esterase [Pirellulaceae bacterium]
MNTRLRIVTLTLLLSLASTASGQPKEFNYDESKVPKFNLPDPLKLSNGDSVKDAAAWRSERRPQVLELFREHVYGRSPKKPRRVFAEVVESGQALEGRATRKQVDIRLQRDGGPVLHVLIYSPAKSNGPTPAFLGLNFNGNHTVSNDPAVPVTKNWVRRGKNNRASADSRGTSASRWQVDRIVKRGYSLVTLYYGDIDPDFDDGFKNGIHPLYLKKGQAKPAADEWGSIAAWAWGLSRVLDYLHTDESIDQTKVAVIGHSRLGKTSLWAGAEDPRFAIVISNNSGCGGAALSRRRFGETVKRINTSFPHWFCDNFNKYNDNENELPVDQHMLVALMAPRPVYIASAEQDRWADPRGEFLSAKFAEPVYRLLNAGGLGAEQMPAVDKPVADRLGYHIRTGKHDVTAYDWDRYLDFADKHYGR